MSDRLTLAQRLILDAVAAQPAPEVDSPVEPPLEAQVANLTQRVDAIEEDLEAPAQP